MVTNSPLYRQAKRLYELAGPPRWAFPATVVLGLAGAALEGFGLILFIPLLQSLGAPSSRASGLARYLEKPFAIVDAAHMTGVIVVLLCASIVVKNGVGLFNSGLTKFVNGDVAHRVRTRLFQQTLSSCIDFRPGVRRADIATTMSTESWNVSRGLGILFGMAVSLITAAIFMGLMVAISPSLTLFAVGFLLAASLVVRFATRHADLTGRAVVEENKQFGLRMWESIQSLQVIRAFSREQFENERFYTLSDTLRRRMLRLEMLWAVPGSIAEVSVTCLIGLLIFVASDSRVGIASLAAFLSLLYRLQGPVRDLLQSSVVLDSLWGSIEGVAELLHTTAEPHLADGKIPAVALRSGISLRNLSFAYGLNEPWALDDVSFDIPVGKTTAIVGESGAGKSTLMSLLFRFQDPSSGSITADDTPLAQLLISSWRARLALMSQEVQLFNDTIAANIGYGRAGAIETEIAAAAKTARAHEFIMALPQGYNTMIGDQGLRLSGGQRQRIALARTVLRDPDILLLDEATNALDIESEQAFQLALDEYSHRRTVIVIAHRLSTVSNADQIIVLAHGRVIEAGTPRQLMDNAGQFARMYKLQHSPVLARVDG